MNMSNAGAVKLLKVDGRV